LYDMPYYLLRNDSDLQRLGWLLTENHSSIINVRSSLDFRFACRVRSTMVGNVLTPDAFEDMSPKLPAGELEGIMDEIP